MIKKVILLALSLCIVLCVAGCGAEMPQPGTAGPQVPQLATPEGVYNAKFAAKITNLKEGYMAYFTLDGSEPNADSMLYTDAGISLEEGDNLVKVINYDKAGNPSDVLSATLTIAPYEPDYSNTFARLHKEGNTIYYVQSEIGPHSEYSPFPEYGRLCSYSLSDGNRKVVLDQDMTQFVIQNEVIYDEYETAIGDGELCFLWRSADIKDGKRRVLLDSTTEASEIVNYDFGSIMVDEWIYYHYFQEGKWNLFRINVKTTEKESISQGEGLLPAIVVDRDIIYWGAGRKLYSFDVDSAENTLICSDPGSMFKVFGSFIYYYTEEPSCVYRMRLDGSDKQQIPKVTSSEFVVVGDRIYYSSADGIFGMRVDGVDNEKICSIVPKNLQYYQGKLFFNGEKNPSSGGVNLFCLDLATNEVSVLFEGKGFGFVYFVDGEIYYVYNRVIESEAGLYHLTDSGPVKLAGQLR